MDESTLITAAKTGDVESFNVLVLAYQDIAYSVAYRILHDQQMASDATQNAFISAFRHLHQFTGPSFKAWLLRIVTNACYDELRRHKRQPTTSLDDLIEDGSSDELMHENNPNWAANMESPEHIIQRHELQEAIEDCLGQLNESYRIVAVMVDVEGYSYEEVAGIADISLGTVKSRLSRARDRLRDCLRKREELLPGQYRLRSS
jgi:RNA polymerase sigma-70 factor (ECF subfamily)